MQEVLLVSAYLPYGKNAARVANFPLAGVNYRLLASRQSHITSQTNTLHDKIVPYVLKNIL